MKAVILAGGLGKRLKPFTDILPKPLIPFGEKSLLEIQIEQLVSNSFNEIFLAVNHKADMIKSFLGDGSKYNAKLKYSLEKTPLGTCGPLSLLKNDLKEPFVMINGDILTKANYKHIYESVDVDKFPLTIITKEIYSPFRFGNIESKNNILTHIEEKPNMKFNILAGMYIFSPKIFDWIPENTYFGMDDLINLLLSEKVQISTHNLKDYWVDIGVIEDYKEAQTVYEKNFT